MSSVVVGLGFAFRNFKAQNCTSEETAQELERCCKWVKSSWCVQRLY